MENRQAPDGEPRKNSPSMGERAALAGYVPQYDVAAGLLLSALTDEKLEWLALLDPEAGRLDDFQLATPHRLDAYQVKWTQAGGQIAWSELRSYLVDLLADRRRLAVLNQDRTVVGHLFSDRVASSSPISAAPDEWRNATLAGSVAELLRPATECAFDSVGDLPGSWRWLWKLLAEAAGLTEDDLLVEFAFVRIDLGKALPSRAEVPGRDTAAYRRDIDELMVALLRLATDDRQLVRLTKDQLLARLGGRWQQRLELRSVHEFPRPLVALILRETVSAWSVAGHSHRPSRRCSHASQGDCLAPVSA